MPPRTRRKEMAKKSRHDDRGASSGAAAEQHEPVVPGGRTLGHLNYIQRARVEELQKKSVSGGFYFDYPLLDSYGCREEVERLTAQPFWENLFSWRDDTYVPVVYEFIATFEATEVSHRFAPSIKFTMFGQEYNLSINQLGRYLGLYSQEFMSLDEYHTLPDDFESDEALEQYWHRVTGGNAGRFIGAKPNTAKILNPALKALKLLLGLTFGGRHKNLHKVYRTDLFRLWSLEMNRPIQMACMVKQWLQTQASDKCTYVWIGPIVTRLCEGMGLHRQLHRERRKATMSPLGLEQLSRSYIPKIDDVPMQAEEEQQQPAPGVGGGQEVPPEYMDYPAVHDWASMRALQIQLHTHAMDTFNRRMDLQDEALARQEARQEQQFQAVEQLRLWMEHRFPPPSQGGDGSY